jgi:hypothetical protein
MRHFVFASTTGTIIKRQSWMLLLCLTLSPLLVACGGPNACELIEATNPSDCISRGCDAITTVRNARVVYACQNQDEDHLAIIHAGGGAE